MKQPKHKVKVTLNQIEIVDRPHYAKWTYQGIFQKFLNKKEMEDLIYQFSKRDYAYMMLVNPPEHTEETLAKKYSKQEKRREKRMFRKR